MSLGRNLFHARKKKGFSQEDVAEKLGVSRQTISKWETDETLPDIYQSKRLAVLYGLSLDQNQFMILLQKLKKNHGYNDLDAFLVLKDILGGLWKKIYCK